MQTPCGICAQGWRVCWKNRVPARKTTKFLTGAPSSISKFPPGVYSVSFDIAPGASGSPPEYFIRAILYKIHTHREQHGKHNRYEIKIDGSYEMHVGSGKFW